MELKTPELAEPTQLPNIICNQPLYQGQTDVGTDIDGRGVMSISQRGVSMVSIHLNF